MWKEAAVVIYCWNYCRKKQFWSFTAEITEEGSSCGHLLMELLWKERAVVIYRWNYCGKKQLLFTAGITEEGGSCCHLPLELLRKGVKLPRHQHSFHQKRAVFCTAYYFVRFYILLTLRLFMILGK